MIATLALAPAACADPGPDSTENRSPLILMTEDSMIVRVHRVPLEQLYGRHWQTKRLSYDIRYFDGRVFFGHGSTDSPVGTKIVYFDPASQAFEVETDGRGRDVEIPEEIIDRFRVFEGSLYVNSRDPVRGGSHFIRRDDGGAWTSRVIAPMAHNYDIYLFKGTFLISHPTHRGDFPGILTSRDGRAFESLDGSALHLGPYTPYFEFIEVGDELFATTIGSRMTTVGGVRVTSEQPWMVRFDVSDGVSVEPVAQDPSDLLDGLIDEPMSPAQLRRAVRTGEGTFALNGAAQIVRLQGTAPSATLLPIVLEDDAYIADLSTDEQGRLLALIVRRLGDGMTAMEIRVMEEAGAWTRVLSLEIQGVPSSLDSGGGALYVGGHDGLLVEVRPMREASDAAP